MQTRLSAFFLALALAGTAVAQAQTSGSETLATRAGVLVRTDTLAGRPPPASAGQVAGQIAIGTLLGGVSGLAGGLAGAALSPSDSWAAIGNALGGAIVGQLLGSGLVVYAAGRTDAVSGNFTATLLGAGAGALVSFLVLASTENAPGYLILPVLLLGPPLGATLFNNTSRRYRNPPQQSGLINLDRSGFSVGVPAVGVTRLADPHRTVARSVRLLTASW